MHIAFWSPGWPLAKFQNGIVTYVHWMKRELEAQGHTVSIFTGALDASSAAPRIYPVLKGPDPFWGRILRRVRGSRNADSGQVFAFGAAIAQRILQVHRREPIDLIEMEESFGWFADAERLTRIPLLVKLHGPAFLSLVEEEVNTAFGLEKIAREGEALRGARAIASPCQSTLAQTIERYGLRVANCRHIVNPLPITEETPPWDLHRCNPLMILFVGRFDLRKGADIVLKAFAFLLAKRPDLQLVFVGPDRGLVAPDGTTVHFESYCDSLFPAPLRRSVVYRGALENSEVGKLRTEAMVTVVASRWENPGYTVLEAMAQGCPLVSSDAGGCPESVIDGITGRIARSGDSEDFATQILAMLEGSTAAEAMGRAARSHILRYHSPASVASETLSMYSKVIAEYL